MAKLSDLVRGTSEITGVPVATVREVSRRLREGGLIRTGKAGRYGGAEMTRADAARLLTALMIAKASRISLNEIVSLTNTYLRGLTSHSPRGHHFVLDRWNQQLGLVELCRLKVGHTFEDAIVGLVSSMSSSNFKLKMPKWGSVDVVVEVCEPTPQPEAKVIFHTTNFGTLDLSYIPCRQAKSLEAVQYKKWSDIPVHIQCDMRGRATITESTLKYITLMLGNYERSDA
jgi:hypothetical protein